MMKGLLGLAVAAVALTAAPVDAKQCRDAKGKFVPCPAEKPVAKCKDAKGRFAKCGTPGAKPA